MPGGAVKKIVKKKSPAKKRATRTTVKPVAVKARKKVVPRRKVKKVPKKINLKVRAVRVPVAKKTVSKKTSAQSVASPKSAKKLEKQTVSPRAKVETTRASQGRVIDQRTEQDKQFLMWAGVSFFMVLIIIFWVYNTKEGIKRSRVEWQSSEKAIEWGQMADELGDKISEIKNDVEALRSFASSSGEQDLQVEERASIFQTSSSSSKIVNERTIEDLKHKLEIKIGLSEPEKNDYYFVLEDEELTALLFGLEDVEIGDELDQVKTILDEPSFEQELKDQRGVFVAKITSYYIKIYQEDTVSEIYDRYISLEFDQDDILVKINKFLD